MACERGEKLPQVERRAVACFLVSGDEVVLGMKKRGFGEGHLMPVGGKIGPGETSEKCVVREVAEELRVTLVNPVKVGTIDFYYSPESKIPSQSVDFYVAEFSGDPVETDEMAPERFNKKNIPYERMLPTNGMFVPIMLRGGTVNGFIVFDGQMKRNEFGLNYFNVISA